jgi:succinate dehydrogenase / fumarate reductase membrane anchor subunit
MGQKTSLERFGDKGTALGHVRGLGSAQGGTHHWLMQRFTAVGNLLLVGFLVISLALMPNYSYATIHNWMEHPVPATALALICVNTFWHARIGLQVLIEDYLDQPGSKLAALVALNVAIFGGAAFGLVSIARIALGAA